MYKNTIRIALIFGEKLIFTVCFTDSPQTSCKKTDDYGYTTVLYRRGEKAGHGSSKKRTDQEWDAESGGRPWKIRRIKNKRTGVDSQR